MKKIIKTFNEFIEESNKIRLNEGIFDELLNDDEDEENETNIKRYVGNLPDGTKLIMPVDADPVMFGDKMYTYIDVFNGYFVVNKEEGSTFETFYMYNPNAKEGEPNLVELFTVDNMFRKKYFDYLYVWANYSLDSNSGETFKKWFKDFLKYSKIKEFDVDTEEQFDGVRFEIDYIYGYVFDNERKANMFNDFMFDEMNKNEDPDNINPDDKMEVSTYKYKGKTYYLLMFY